MFFSETAWDLKAYVMGKTLYYLDDVSHFNSKTIEILKDGYNV